MRSPCKLPHYVDRAEAAQKLGEFRPAAHPLHEESLSPVRDTPRQKAVQRQDGAVVRYWVMVQGVEVSDSERSPGISAARR